MLSLMCSILIEKVPILFNSIESLGDFSRIVRTQIQVRLIILSRGVRRRRWNLSTLSPLLTSLLDTGHLIGMWSALNTIFFSVQGFFTVSVTAAENKHVDRDESIKLATRKIALRVILLYVLVVFTVGLNVPCNDFNLQDTSISSIRRGQNSPIIIACVRNGVVGWPHFLNAFCIFSAYSCGVNGLYISSRLLHALASIRNVWPATGWGARLKHWMERTNAKGVPVNAVFVS